MCNANNLISSVRTSGIRIRITGYSFRKSLETEKNMLESFLHQGKNATYVIFVQNHLKREKTQKKKSFSPLAPPDSELDPDPQEDFCPDPDLQKKNADAKH